MTSATTPMNLTRAAHAGISVPDLDASIAFHKALTGREPVTEGPATASRPRCGVVSHTRA
ncbi:hypothetical protein [Streptomyces sp. NPDC002215]|uniref:hypothetical protein n=1 Tax=Streptomyces sp. NPDC002215 TaxID=3154412 RepID=UPI003332805C